MSPKGMDKLFLHVGFWRYECWAKGLAMVVKVQELNVDKLFKIAKLDLHGKAKNWFKKLNFTPID
jgi:hypothetical protein